MLRVGLKPDLQRMYRNNYANNARSTEINANG